MSRGYHRRLKRSARVIEHFEKVHGVRTPIATTEEESKKVESEASTGTTPAVDVLQEDAE